ncbi:DUF1819 family protein [Exiguobacterium sp. SH0S1]|uniref:DUF1819 family protein n=1 Tax=Exiguobacterium sp. SH0S1 TaxID=2510949 RepID=UPI00103C48D7|nr:DUF1819 family protein [Exiguobacterium sp. SH0S1]TCI75717.1 DUF1819 family protein [Exiguobacterium sp. SH0S1]
MMEYSAGFTSEAWFQQELQTVLEYKQKGYSRQEILYEIMEHNLFQMRNESGIRRRFQMVYRRAETFTPALVKYFLNSSRLDQKALTLYSFLKAYRYAYEFFQEVVVFKYQEGKPSLQTTDLAHFLELKEEQSEKVRDWRPDTKKRIASAILLFLRESDLLEQQNSFYTIRPLYMSQSLKQYAEQHDLLLYLLSNLKAGDGHGHF